MNSDARWSAQELRDELNRYEKALQEAGRLTRSTINTYVQHPERFINWLDGRYQPVQSERNWVPGTNTQGAGVGRTSTRSSRYDTPTFTPGPPPPARQFLAGSSRYDPLRLYLEDRREPVVRLSFVEIERIIGAPLPASARRHRPWWANERSGNHVHALAWMGADRRTANVDLNAGSVDFIR
jgi:hypothetical protein